MLEPTNTVETLIRNSSTPGKPGQGRKIHPLAKQQVPGPGAGLSDRKKNTPEDKKQTKQNEKPKPKVLKVAAKCRRQKVAMETLRLPEIYTQTPGNLGKHLTDFLREALVVLHALS